MHRSQQPDQRLLILGPRKFLQRTTQRLILNSGTSCYARGIGRQKGKRIVFISPILGQMEADSPHLVPQRRPLLQES